MFNLDVHRYLVTREVNSLSTDDATAIADVLGLGRVGAHSALLEFAKTCISPDWLQLLIIMQRDSGANHYAHNRPKNEGLMLVAGNVFKDRLDEVIEEIKAKARDEHLPKPVKAAAPKTASTPNPAAQATPTRAQGKAQGAKGKTTPAAQARATAPKTTKAEATAQIAAALAEAEGSQIQAPTAHGNEGAPAPAGGVAGDAALGDTAAPVGPSVAWPDPEAARQSTAPDSAAAPCGKGSAGAKTGAAMDGGEFKPGIVATVRATASNAKWRGRKVTVLEVGATIKVRQADTPSNKAERCSFFAEDLEAL